jgi:hypothetical protein
VKAVGYGWLVSLLAVIDSHHPSTPDMLKLIHVSSHVDALPPIFLGRAVRFLDHSIERHTRALHFLIARFLYRSLHLEDHPEAGRSYWPDVRLAGKPSSGNPKSDTPNLKPKIQKPEICNTNPEARNPKPKTQSPQPETQNPKPEIRKTETRNPKPETRNSKPKTQYPNSEFSNPKSETRNPKPETRNPKPET